jgi:hypothetical protein
MIDTVTKYYFRGEHAGYLVTYKNSNITQSVPVAEDNKDYQEIQQWISEGNTVIDNGE